MRAAIISDSHFDVANRLSETVHAHRWIAQDCRNRGVNVTLLGGDTFERKSTPEDRNACADWLIEQAACGPIFGVYGNHDVKGDLRLLDTRGADHPVIFADEPRVESIPGLVVGLLPWPRVANVHAWADTGLSIEQAREMVGDLMRQVIAGLGVEMERTAAEQAHQAGRRPWKVLVTHIMISGSTTDHNQPVIGSSIEVSLSDLVLADADLVACGHIHAFNSWTVNGAPVIYPGAPKHTNFGEPAPKGYVIVDFDEDDITWQRVFAPVPDMILAEDAWIDGAFASGVDHVATVTPGAEVRLRFSVDHEYRADATSAAEELMERMLAAGASLVKLEPIVNPKSTARCAEITEARTLSEKLRRLWTVRGDTPDEARADRLCAMAEHVAEEVRDAAA